MAIPLNIAEDNGKAKALLDRIVAMLMKLGLRGYSVHEMPGEYRTGKDKTDSDPDGNGREDNRHRERTPTRAGAL